MKKATVTKKSPRGCAKITSFFTKVENGATPKLPKPNLQLKSSINKDPKVIIISSPENSDEEESLNLLHPSSSIRNNKRKIDGETSGVSPPIKKASTALHPSPSGTTITNPVVEQNFTTVPSTSGSTPIKHVPVISVKTPQKLLSAHALAEFLNTDQTMTQVTPIKSPKVLLNSPKRSGSGSKVNRSPRVKHTPKKLFEKSPKNINEFNVEVLKSFVKVTPIKTSPSSSLEVQEKNEKTPVKVLNKPISPKMKVKSKLDFSDCNVKENVDTTNLSCIFDDTSWDVDILQQLEFSLDLSTSQHSKIVSILQSPTGLTITVKSTETNEQAVCTVQGFWMHLKLCIGDTIHIMAVKSGDNWLVNNSAGYLVFEPDLLVSSTSVVNSVFCKRRSVFKEQFRGFDPTNKFMIVGQMVHGLLQDSLRLKMFEANAIKKLALDTLKQPNWARQIYESGESVSFITEEFLKYVPQVVEFIEVYVKQSRANTKKGNWKGSITAIEDIEENIWCPELGIKGKVDVSVRSKDTVIPLEIKTGRVNVSIEHRGQVLLYIMLMNKLGYQVTSGLLLYLKEGVLKEIPPSQAEKRDLIILRNELAYFLSRNPKVVKTEQGQYVEPPEVPEGIDHPSCSKCPYSSVCMAYSKYSKEDVTAKKNLSQVHDTLSDFLTTAHIDYFMHWVSLLSIEASDARTSKTLRDIYTLPPNQRKLKGKCLIDLEIVEVVEDLSGVCQTTFRQVQNGDDNFILSGLLENSYVVVSLKSRPAVASGFVTHISEKVIIVSLDRNLKKRYQNEKFYLDSYESSAISMYNFSSLAIIVEVTEEATRLRSIIIDKQPATFQPTLPKTLADTAKPILKRLNKVQQRAVLKSIAANDYYLIKGMPGTGKTATIVALTQLLVELKQSVLITSHTHSAVDNVCLKLLELGVKFMRLGVESKINPSLKNYSEHYLTKDCVTPEDFEAVYNGAQVLAVTCMGSGHVALSKRTLNVCIVDESTQVLQCEVFRPLSVCKKFILIGDPNQLSAVVQSKTAIQMGMNESLFERLETPEAAISLNLSYRMNQPITALANALMYNGELQPANDKVANATLNIPGFVQLTKTYPKDTWIVDTLSPKLENSVRFLDTGPVWNLPNRASWSPVSTDQQELINIFEAAIIYRLVEALIKVGKVPAGQVGVIATYKIQVVLLAKILKPFEVAVNTVDQFQGKDKYVILYSCSKSRDDKTKYVDKFDLTENKRRLNVAITRAKHKLIIVGDMRTLRRYSSFSSIQSELEKTILSLPDYEEFDWEQVLNLHI